MEIQLRKENNEIFIPDGVPLPGAMSRTTHLGVAAHPDDLEYGAASAVARWTGQGKWVGYVLATSGEASASTRTRTRTELPGR